MEGSWWRKICYNMGVQAAMEDVVLDTILTSAFDATSDKVDSVRKELEDSLRATSIQAARCGLIGA